MRQLLIIRSNFLPCFQIIIYISNFSALSSWDGYLSFRNKTFLKTVKKEGETIKCSNNYFKKLAELYKQIINFEIQKMMKILLQIYLFKVKHENIVLVFEPRLMKLCLKLVHLYYRFKEMDDKYVQRTEK